MPLGCRVKIGAFSFILGLRALMLLVGSLYLLALFCRPRR